MPADALIDTGAILALLDRTDRWHDACINAFRDLRLPLLTSEAVLTGLFHLVGDVRPRDGSRVEICSLGSSGSRCDPRLRAAAHGTGLWTSRMPHWSTWPSVTLSQ